MKIEKWIRGIVLVFFIFMFGLITGVISYELFAPTKHGIFIEVSKESPEIKTVEFWDGNIYHERYVAKDKDGKKVLFIESPPYIVWIGDFK